LGSDRNFNDHLDVEFTAKYIGGRILKKPGQYWYSDDKIVA